MIEILNYEKANKNKIIGYVDIRIPKSGMIIRKIAHLQSDQKKWFNFPTFSKDQPDGKAKYYPYVQFELEAHNGQFFEILAEKVKEFCVKHDIKEPQPLDLTGTYDGDLPF